VPNHALHTEADGADSFAASNGETTNTTGMKGVVDHALHTGGVEIGGHSHSAMLKTYTVESDIGRCAQSYPYAQC
jgi:hypothetical protein